MSHRRKLVLVSATTMKFPPTLYHYTNQAGLFGILQGKEFWASSIEHLNDETEFKYATSLFEDALRKNGEAGINTLLSLSWSKSYGVFVISFSQRGDRLSQWRAYCRDGGFSIGFDTDKLKNLAELQGFVLERCDYSPRGHRRKVAELIRLATLEEKDRELNLEPVGQRMLFLDELVKFATTAKDWAFVEEKEWRLVGKEGPGGIFPHLRPVFFREGRIFPIPHQKLLLHEEIKRGLIAEVVIGPGPHKKLVAKTVGEFLASLGCSARVVESSTPYRNW